MAVAFRSGGWGEPDARAAAGLAGLEPPRRCFAGSSSERAAWALQAVLWAAVWSWSLCAGRLNHLGTQNGRLGAGRGSPRRGRRCSESARRSECSGRCQGLQAKRSSANETRSRAEAHQGVGSKNESGAGGRQRCPAAEFGDGSMRGGCSGLHGKLCGVPAMKPRGQ